jgi:aspartate 1-decarboxylase
MDIKILKSKVHRAIITEANLNYVGSLEKVQIVNINKGNKP